MLSSVNQNLDLSITVNKNNLARCDIDGSMRVFNWSISPLKPLDKVLIDDFSIEHFVHNLPLFSSGCIGFNLERKRVDKSTFTKDLAISIKKEIDKTKRFGEYRKLCTLRLLSSAQLDKICKMPTKIQYCTYLSKIMFEKITTSPTTKHAAALSESLYDDLTCRSNYYRFLLSHSSPLIAEYEQANNINSHVFLKEYFSNDSCERTHLVSLIQNYSISKELEEFYIHNDHKNLLAESFIQSLISH